jgi:hypothetical protein
MKKFKIALLIMMFVHLKVVSTAADLVAVENSTTSNNSTILTSVQSSILSAQSVVTSANDVIAIMNDTGALLDQQNTIILSDMVAKVTMALAKVAEFSMSGDCQNVGSSLILISNLVSQAANYIYEQIKANPTQANLISLSNVIGFVGSAVAAMAVKECSANPLIINFLIVFGGDIIIDVANAVLLASTINPNGVIDVTAAQQAASASRDVYNATQAADISSATTCIDVANILVTASASKTSPLIKSATLPANSATAAGTAKSVLAGASMVFLIESLK